LGGSYSNSLLLLDVVFPYVPWVMWSIFQNREKLLSSTGVLCALGLLTLLSSPASADKKTAEYFRQLRSRHLFSVAENYCLEQLAGENSSFENELEYTLELSKTYTEHARFTSGEDQRQLWELAVERVTKLMRKRGAEEYLPLLQHQHASVLYSKGRYLRWQAMILSHDDQLRSAAVSDLQAAIAQFRTLETELSEALRKIARTKGARVSVLAPHKIRNLVNSSRYRLAVCQLNLAYLQNPDSAGYAKTLQSAEGLFRRLAGGFIGEAITVNSQIRLAECLRLQNQLAAAQKQLADVTKKYQSAEILNRVLVERAYLFLAVGRPDSAAELLSQQRKLRGTLSGELHFVNVQTLLELWKLTQQKQQQALADSLKEQLLIAVRRAEREAGGVWSYRCRLLLENLENVQKFGPELAGLIRKAHTLHATSELPKAIEAYAQAAALAHRQQHAKTALQLGYARAHLLLETNQLNPATEAFRELTEQFPDETQAADAHLMWSYCLGKLYDKNRTKDRRTAYTQALEDHRKQFSGQPSAFEATWMLARLEERRLQSTKALDLYLEIPEDHPRGLDAQVGVARTYEQILSRLRELKQPVDAWETNAINQLQTFAEWFPKPPEALSQFQAELALRLARIYLNRSQPDYNRAERLLERVLTTEENRSTDVQPGLVSWKSLRNTAVQLQIVSLAGQGQPQRARALVLQLATGSAEEVLSVLNGLMQVRVEMDSNTRAGLGELQLQTALDLGKRADQLQPDQKLRLQHCLAQAYAATNQPAQAIKVYDQLLASAPNDKRLIQTVAALQLGTKKQEFVKRALKNFRKLEAQEKQGTTAWFEAKYQVLSCMLELGQFAECKKVLAVTKLLYRDFGGERTKAKFEELERKLKEPRP